MNTSINNIQPNPYNTRQDYGDLDGLKVSIQKNGILYPLIVRPGKRKDEYELVFGGRRLQSLRELGYHEIPIELKEVSDADMAILSLCENVHRKDLNPVELARAYRVGLASTQLPISDFARITGESASKINRYLTILELPGRILDHQDRYDVSQLVAMGRLHKLSQSVRIMFENALNERDISYNFISAIVSSCESIWASSLPEKSRMNLCAEVIQQDYSHLPPRNHADIGVFAKSIFERELIRYNEKLRQTAQALEKARKARGKLPKKKIREIKDIIDVDRELEELTTRLNQDCTYVRRAYDKGYYQNASQRSQKRFRTAVNRFVSGLEEILKNDQIRRQA